MTSQLHPNYYPFFVPLIMELTGISFQLVAAEAAPAAGPESNAAVPRRLALLLLRPQPKELLLVFPSQGEFHHQAKSYI
jgi:hypothetical protein